MTSSAIEWIAAAECPPDTQSELEEGAGDSKSGSDAETAGTLDEQAAPSGNRDLWIYRDRTVAMLHRYERMALQVGRLPSLLGREFFRTQVTSYSAHTFEDSVIFVHDIERCLDMLSPREKEVIAIVVLQEHTHYEAARLLRTAQANITRYFADAVDRVSELFLQRGILARVPVASRGERKSCQEGESGDFAVSDSNQGKNKSAKNGSRPHAICYSEFRE